MDNCLKQRMTWAELCNDTRPIEALLPLNDEFTEQELMSSSGVHLRLAHQITLMKRLLS